MRLSSEISNVKAWQTYEMCGLPWDCKPRNYANSLVGLFFSVAAHFDLWADRANGPELAESLT